MKKWCILFVLGFTAYFIIGLIAPFAIQKKPSLTAKNTANDLISEFFPEDPDDPDDTAGTERAMILETNESAWEERIRLFSQAEERIVLTTFDMRECESTMDLLSVLLKKANEGVDVKILVDGFSGLIRMEHRPLFYAMSSHPNVEIRIYNKINPLLPWKSQGRHHDKYIMIDNKAYVLGGRNTFDYFIGDYPTDNRSHDREVLVVQNDPAHPGESMKQLDAYFRRIWSQKDSAVFHNDPELAQKEKVREKIAFLEDRYESIRESHPELFEPYDYKDVTYETEHIALLSNPTTIYGKEPDVFHQIIQLLKQADNRVIIQTPYIVCNSYMLDELSKLREIVPDSKILINSVENGDNFMASSDYTYRKKKIWDVGIPVFEYDGGYSTHGKSMIIDDDISMIGSYNMDLRSTYVDTELMLVIKSKGITSELLGYMNDMEHDSRRVTPEGTYEFPDHIEKPRMPLFKNILMHIVGVIMQPFRVML